MSIQSRKIDIDQVPLVQISGKKLHNVSKYEYLGVIMDKFNMNTHIEHITKKVQGKLLQEIIDLNNLHVPSITEETAEWTRENRTKPSERSVIDYIITTEDSNQRIKDTHIDKEKELLLTGKKPSDHNTITCTLHAKTKKIPTKTIKKRAPGNKETWRDYNDKMNSLHPSSRRNETTNTTRDQRPDKSQNGHNDKRRRD